MSRRVLTRRRAHGYGGGAVALPYRCLILDHDDTAVDSTARVHHPAHVAGLAALRPGKAALSLEGWFLKNFDPGIGVYLRDELGLSAEELQEELGIWREHTRRVDPPFYPGFIETLRRFRAQGGIITVVSHSEADVVLRHYGAATVEQPLLPDLVFGWEQEEHRRKPSPWPAQQILRTFELQPSEALIVDDLKAGVIMGERAGVPVAAAGWGHRIALIESYMRKNCVAYFPSVQAFAQYILG
jgi:HAD superfamily hydrolase (TIGR01509 family)